MATGLLQPAMKIGNEDDRDRRNALAARGCYEAFQAVKECVAMVLKGDNPGAVADDHHGAWYRALWAPSVTAGPRHAG